MKRVHNRHFPRTFLALLLTSLAVAPAFAGQLGFEEDFALAPDRSVPLKQLIPGTPDYYYYHTLQYQNTGDLPKAQETLNAWISRHGRDNRTEEMENRQALLTYDKDARAALDLLTRRLGLTFNQERETVDQQRALPTTLDPALITPQTLTTRALSYNPNTLAGFENSALDSLDAAALSLPRLHEFLSRLERPDLPIPAGAPSLPALIVKDLQSPFSSGFNLPIHHQLLLTQLDELLKLRPELLNDSDFVNTYLARLRPANGLDWRHDPKEQQAYLDRLWAFASRLGPVHNSLKAHILYQRLTFDRTQNIYDKDRFLAYLQLPRNVPYINPRYMEQSNHRENAADLNADFSPATLYPPIRLDEPLVRSYLLHFFIEAKSFDDYLTLIENNYLKQTFAEAKIVNGLGDQEAWYAMLPPEKYQALKDRIDLDFAFTNQQSFRPTDPVSLDLYVKNVKTLLVKVYDINTPSYYRNNDRELGTDIPLDGLVANDETVLTYDDAPLRRVARHFDFPKLDHRGAYIIEFIGNGISSRALVIKGKLHFLEHVGAAGHVFTLLDEANKTLTTASLWLAGHEYLPDPQSGAIVVPYSTAPGDQSLILQLGDFASFDRFNHQSENYSFQAAFHLDRESLIRGATASVIIRPMLYVNDQPVSLRLLEEPTLLITSINREGTPTSKEIPNFPLLLDRETTYDFQVPDNLASVSFTLRAKIQNLSQNKKIDLADSHQFSINAIDASDKIEDLFLSHADNQYHLDLLGKSGEPLPDRPVHLTLKHRDFTQSIEANLKTDAHGRINLGPLPAIATVTAASAEGVAHTWSPAQDLHSAVANAHGLVGQPILLPYMGAAPTPAELSLLELRDGAFYADRFSALSLKDGLLSLDDLPAGDYSLRYKATNQTVAIRIAPGEIRDGWILSATRFLQQRDPAPLQIAAVTADPANLTIKLINFSKLTRVHVIATRYLPELPLFAGLGQLPFPDSTGIDLAILDAQYVAGRNIGDEYRYILDRKYAKIFPGNMLTRPGLLLNPWSIRKTETGRQLATAGELAAGQAGQAYSAPMLTPAAYASQQQNAAGFFSNYDFLPDPSAVFVNLLPDDHGLITIPRKDLGDHQQIHVLALDLGVAAYREISLPEIPLAPRDLRLKTALDGAEHFAEQKEITIVQKAALFTANDAFAADMEVYDSLPRVYKLFSTLSNNATLAEFSFILDWPKFTPAQKQEKYSKYACHELNFFLSRKDPAFFKSVIQPYLQNKKDKTFMDHYLLGDDLAPFLKPWNYDRLNTAEQALLAERLAAEQPATARHIKDRYDLLPPDTDRFNFLFRTALQSSALDSGVTIQAGVALDAAATSPGQMMASNGAIALSGGAFGGGGGAGGGGGGGRGGRGGAVYRPNSRAAAARAPTTGLPAAIDAERKLSEDETANLRRDRETASDIVADAGRRAAIEHLYLKLDKTEEWVEDNYYHLPIEEQVAPLIPVSAFWKDYAAAPVKTGFLSVNLAEAARNFSEMMLALAVLDLPFESPKHDTARKDSTFTLTAGGPLVVFHREIRLADLDPAKTPILVSQNYFRASDRYTYVDNERADKYIADEFLTHVVYGCQVVVTNPTSSRQKLDVLLQIPQGALPVNNGLYIRGLHADLNPFESRAIEYYFYFPSPGSFSHYPVHVARNEKTIAFTPAATLKVVDTPSKIDTASWDYISQNGTSPEVLEFLQNNNIDRLNLERIAWRMKDADFFSSVINLLAARHVYNHTLWSFALKHNTVPAIREFLQHADQIANNVGPYINTTLLTIDPVARFTYQQMEYSPFVNARAHRMGRAREIVNDRAFAQYENLLTVLRYRSTLDNDDLMAVTYYLLLQDRIDEAQIFFARVDSSKLATHLQYDYFKTYFDFFTDTHAVARALTDQYKQYPVDRWRQLFAAAAAQLDEIDGKPGSIINKDDRDQQQAALAAAAPNLDFKVESRKITLNYHNVANVRVNYYLMDIELMFSQNPFLGQFTGQFSSIRPNDTAALPLDPAKTTLTFNLPEKFQNSNVMIEIVADGVTRSSAYYANSLAVQLTENYGQLRVTSEKSAQPLAKVYVKVYARQKDGRTEFYKDGYTDLRGRFDYTSLSTNDLDNVDRFSILILSDTEGAIVREAAPPKQ